MYIHNFYSDVALSVRILLDKYIFRSAERQESALTCCASKNFIKSYEFNIGNKLFQLGDYKTQYEFPNAIITLNDENPAFGHRPQVFRETPGINIDQIPVLYNRTTDYTIYVQEECHHIPLSIQFNCESQLQAKEVEHAVRWMLHINKWFEPFSFTSFFEVSSDFLDKHLFDPNNHDIVNLFTKMMHERGQIAYCFSINYRPLIRLDSINASIAEPGQRSFQTTAEITYLIQMPVHLIGEKLRDRIECVQIHYQYAYEPIIDGPVQPVLQPDGENACPKTKPRTYIVYDDEGTTQTEEDLDCVSISPDQNEVVSLLGLIKIKRVLPNLLYIWIRDTLHKIDVTSGEPQTISNECEKITITPNEDESVTVCIVEFITYQGICFHPDDFLFSYNQEFSFFRNGEYTYPTTDQYEINFDTNCVTFRFLTCEYDLPTVVDPIVLIITAGSINVQYGNCPDVNLVRVGEITSFSAIVWYTTCSPIPSVIEYGPEGSPGSPSPGSPEGSPLYVPEYGFFTDGTNINRAGNFVTTTSPPKNTHKVLLWGLEPDTTYHFRVNTVTDEGQAVISDDYTFTTLSL